METTVSPYLVNGSNGSRLARANPEKHPPGADTQHFPQSSQGVPEQSEDRVDLSPAARNSSNGETDPRAPVSAAAGAVYSPTGDLNLEQHLQLLNLKTRDREVRAHEQAHLAAAGQYAAGGPSFSYTVGADGRRYAVSGEVPIDISSEATPEETIRKMERIRAAALAPAEPSAADRQIAAHAAIKATKARQEMLETRQQPLSGLAVDGEGEQPYQANGNGGGNRRYGPTPDGVLISVMIRTYQDMQDRR